MQHQNLEIHLGDGVYLSSLRYLVVMVCEGQRPLLEAVSEDAGPRRVWRKHSRRCRRVKQTELVRARCVRHDISASFLVIWVYVNGFSCLCCAALASTEGRVERASGLACSSVGRKHSCPLPPHHRRLGHTPQSIFKLLANYHIEPILHGSLIATCAEFLLCCFARNTMLA